MSGCLPLGVHDLSQGSNLDAGCDELGTNQAGKFNGAGVVPVQEDGVNVDVHVHTAGAAKLAFNHHANGPVNNFAGVVEYRAGPAAGNQRNGEMAGP